MVLGSNWLVQIITSVTCVGRLLNQISLYLLLPKGHIILVWVIINKLRLVHDFKVKQLFHSIFDDILGSNHEFHTRSSISWADQLLCVGPSDVRFEKRNSEY
jgi:hypothetical protein